jgi:uncharacterized membrane protein YhfC
MTDEELIAQLRNSKGWPTLGNAAADRIEALTAKLAAAVDWFETIRDRAKGDYMAHTYYLDALAALATIKRREP